MSRSLLFLLLFGIGSSAMAQVGITPVTTVKTADAPVDYKQAGAPMPALKLLRFRDSISNKAVATDHVKNETEKTTTGHTKKKKHSEEMSGNAAMTASKYVTNSDLDNGASLLVMMFNPTCSHCEDETQLLEKNMALFTKTKIVLLANPTMWDYMPNFSKSYKIADYPSITMGVDSSDFISKTFLYSSLPQINIYDKNRKLLKIFSGEVVIDSLKQYLQ